MKLLMENWRKYLKEETAAFHGVDMEPEEMSKEGDLPNCDPPAGSEGHGYANHQWDAGDKGCPDFSHDSGIGPDHPDIKQAIEFLDNVRPDRLIAYSRGGAVALAALTRAQYQPNVTFVAPAWKRGWVSGIENPTYSNGVIVHGTADESVPLWHSAELSLKTGMPLYVFPGRKHVSILKHKNEPEAGRELTQEEKQQLVAPHLTVDEQNEPFQRKVKAKHSRMKSRLTSHGPNDHGIEHGVEKTSNKRSKSAPPGAGGS